MNHLFKFTFLSLVLIVFIGCEGDKEKVPSYLHIKKFSFSTFGPTEGLNTFEIGAAKVFANGLEVGTFELPITIPVVAYGDVEITLLPTIKENGSSSFHVVYKPYVAYVQTINMMEGKIDTISPSTTYRKTPNMIFAWLEDFDDAGIALERFGINNTKDSLLRIPTNTPGVNQPFAGSLFCGLVDILPRDSAVDFETTTSPGWMTLPNLGTDVYVEMDYKSNVNIQVGIFTENAGVVKRIPVLFTFPTENWKKIYINLKSEISDLPASTKVRVFFGVYKEQSDVSTHPMVYLDNLKLLYVN